MIKRKRRGFTLVEGLISILLVSAISMTSLLIVNGYYKQTYARDKEITAIAQNINTIESVKADVHTVRQLYDFSQSHDICIIAVGIGEVKLTLKADGKIKKEITAPENYEFAAKLKPNYGLYRIETKGAVPNSKLMTIIRIKE
ncbi:MAG: hypothetical protein BWY15_01775 [Firmicutes bacterium ADurb.Bin193]|nr:MAG: hypothetical protein BWY15_01775 [Firmicutes bacterium ADurb.Bin193]